MNSPTPLYFEQNNYYYDPAENLLCQADELVSAKYNFSLIEKRILSIIFLEVQRKGCENEANNITIHLTPDTLLIARNRIGEAYEYLSDLRERTIEIKDRITRKRTSIGLINYVEWDVRKEKIQIEVSYKVIPYLLDLQNNYSFLSLSVLLSLRSVYSQRFYELCQQNRGKGFFSIDIDDLKNMFVVKRKYQDFSVFRNKIINTAQKELRASFGAQKSEVCFQVEIDPLFNKKKKIEKLFFRIEDRLPQTYISNISLIDYFFLCSMELGIFSLSAIEKEKILNIGNMAASPIIWRTILEAISYVSLNFQGKENAKAALLRALKEKQIL